MSLAPDPYLDYPHEWSNCLRYACAMLHRHGGYIVGRRGHNGCPVHFLYVPPGGFEAANTPIYSFEPTELRWTPGHWHDDLLIWFRGHVVKGEGVPEHHELLGLPAGAH